LGTIRNISVGYGDTTFNCPYCIAVDWINNKIYVANTYSNTVSVIDGNNDTVKTIPVCFDPTFMLDMGWEIYVACTDAVYVIDTSNESVENHIHLPTEHLSTSLVVDNWPMYIYEDRSSEELYVLWHGFSRHGWVGPLGPAASVAFRLPENLPSLANGTAKQIPITSALQHLVPQLPDFQDGPPPTDIATPNYLPGVVRNGDERYILNRDNGTVSVSYMQCVRNSTAQAVNSLYGTVNSLNGFPGRTVPPCTSPFNVHKNIVVGQNPVPIASNDVTRILYISQVSYNSTLLLTSFKLLIRRK
jgi:YVTN family beta-propeller protein